MKLAIQRAQRIEKFEENMTKREKNYCLSHTIRISESAAGWKI